jgi:DNA mismatch repair ATPase MutL
MYLCPLFFTIIQHAADERIRLEELRTKVVNITVARNNNILLFHTYIVIMQVLSEEGHVVTYLDSEEELVRHVC